VGKLSFSTIIKNEIRKTKTNNKSCKNIYLRELFLSRGSISDPKKSYHLEISVLEEDSAKQLCELMGLFNLNAKYLKRNTNYVVYLKEGENIVDFLNIIGAHSSLLEFENVRIMKEVRNNINRIVNCETANLEKTVDASIRQIENIKYLNNTKEFQKLNRKLKEIAELRLTNRDATLLELGEMLSPPLGKSGVNYRLSKLDKIAESIRAIRGN